MFTEKVSGTSASYPEELKRAKAAWLAAVDKFQCATDRELTDLAVYGMEAARVRYMYLLKHGTEAG